MVIMLAFYSNNPSLILAEAYIFLCKMFVCKERKYTKEAWVGPFKKIEFNTDFDTFKKKPNILGYFFQSDLVTYKFCKLC